MKNRSATWRVFGWVSELTSVWHETKLIVLTAQVAAIYAAILIPFKVGIPIIPGFVELRPANAIPIVSSLLFGPVAAWGAGIGNIIGDCFGTLGPASIFGFFGNFFLGYLPHVVWGRLGPLSSRKAPLIDSWRQGVEFTVICVMASAVCAATIAWGVELLGFLPFMVLAPAIFFNNVVMGMVLGPPLLWFLYPRVKRWGLYYPDLLQDHREIKDRAVPGSRSVDEKPTSAMGPRTDFIVEMKDVTFQYRSSSSPALNNLSLEIRRGEWMVIMGRRGSGKSTLCHTLSQLIPGPIPGRLSGSIKIYDDLGVLLSKEPNAQVGLVLQDFDTQLVASSVEREVAFPLEYLEIPISPEEMRTRIQAVLHQVGLEDFSHRDPLTLSGGQRQRLVLATVLAVQPTLLVLDQPMTDLDPDARQQLIECFVTLRERGVTIVMTEQDTKEVLEADRFCVLDHGEVCWIGTPRDFLGSPNLATRFGVSSAALAECFRDFALSALPVIVEDAWGVMDEQGLTLEPKENLLHYDHVGHEGNVSTDKPAAFIRFDRVHFEYSKGQPVLSDISCTLSQGEFVAVLGKNGSGKSTFVKLLNGLLRPTGGDVWLGGRNTNSLSMSELSRCVGYVFQNPDHQIFAETVWEEVAFGVKNHGFTPEECERRITEALEAVGLDIIGSRTQDPFSLTKGERQRVAVASVLSMKPDVLIFDEPTTGLDAMETDRMMFMISRLHRQGHTIVIITHAISLVAEYATRCLLMHDGNLLADGSTRAIFSDPSLMQAASLNLPFLTRFSQRWGHTLLTIDEVKAALRSA